MGTYKKFWRYDMRVIVTGGGGFIGSHLVDKLLSLKYEVVVVDEISNHYESNFSNEKITHFFCDIASPTILKKIFKKGDLVMHLAAQSHVDVSYKEPNRTLLSNVIGTNNILNACLENEVSKLVVMSTDEVYGSVEEVNNFDSLNPTNPYSAAKAAADMVVKAFKNMYPDFNLCTLRSNNIAGPRQFIRNIIPRFSCQAILRKKMTVHGDGSSRRRYLWVNDVVDALVLILEKGVSGNVYHTSHPKSYSNLEVAKKISEYLNLDDLIDFVPDRILNDAIYPYIQDDKIKTELGWKITKDLGDFLPETIEYYIKNIEKYRKFLI